MIRCALVTIPGAIVLALGAPFILRIYGSAYAANASTLLGILGTATVPTSVLIIAFALDRVEQRVGRAALSQLALAVLVVAGALLLMRKDGIDGVGLAWLGASVVVAAVRLPTIVRVLRPAAETEPVLPSEDLVQTAVMPSLHSALVLLEEQTDEPAAGGGGGGGGPRGGGAPAAPARGDGELHGPAAGSGGRWRGGGGVCGPG